MNFAWGYLIIVIITFIALMSGGKCDSSIWNWINIPNLLIACGIISICHRLEKLIDKLDKLINQRKDGDK
jgi:hypothetical protein